MNDNSPLNIQLLAHYLGTYEEEVVEYIYTEEAESEEEAKANELAFRESLAKLKAIKPAALSYLIGYLKANIDEIEESIGEDGAELAQEIRETLDILGSDQPPETPHPAPAFVVGTRVKALRGDWNLGTIVGVDEKLSRFQVQWDSIYSPSGGLKKGKKTWYQEKALAVAQEESKP